MATKFQIADWTVDPQQCLLVKTAVNNRLEPKAMALLVVLAEAEGELVSRQKIFETVWPNQHVSDYALNTLIANLRKSLGSQSGTASLIETRPKLGYRLSQPVVWLFPNNPDELLTTSSESSGSNSLNSNLGKWSYDKINTPKKLMALFLILMVVVLLKYFIFDVIKIEKNELKLFDNEVSGEKNLYQNKNKVFRYLIKVVLSYAMSEKDESNKAYCSNVSFETMSKIIYSERKWKVIGQYFTYILDHQGEELINIDEVHTVKYAHVYGIEIDRMAVKLDAIGQLTGHADMQVFDDKGRLICKGKSLFVGTKI